jgi:hypothetical protein
MGWDYFSLKRPGLKVNLLRERNIGELRSTQKANTLDHTATDSVKAMATLPGTINKPIQGSGRLV